ncbi:MULTISPECIES: hypothetical protein [Bacillus cereus group]|uniref:hypothetical protein n=1 Tax=Bacillus cereus group TaxID=86661 RepID=UPI000BF52EF6|nr:MULTISPECIES: hypothetical protein [Bacillus cereus group]NWK72663.1 hypothetical protein [Bacillus paramycoides]PFI81978.1 hypothetical protein COI86_29420 [Bacillus thuringiensis]PFO50787.1 hypothetical protein COJ74_27320 [Bacillus cereus]PGL03267.1 hypothetical protein CN923_00020 [Bacillus cereus]PGT24866.1 hypothetical protein COD04_22720 [Bacillus thuringiensis]
MRSKRELQKQIEKYEEAIDCYKEEMGRLIANRDNPAVTIAQRKMNDYLICDCENYIKQFERKIHSLRHEIAHPPKEQENLYDSIWEQLLSGEPVKAGRLV